MYYKIRLIITRLFIRQFLMPVNTLAPPGVQFESDSGREQQNTAMRYTLMYAIAALADQGLEYNQLFGQQRINGRTIWREP